MIQTSSNIGINFPLLKMSTYNIWFWLSQNPVFDKHRSPKQGETVAIDSLWYCFKGGLYGSQYWCCPDCMIWLWFFSHPQIYWKCVWNEPPFFFLHHFWDHYFLRSNSVRHLKSRSKEFLLILKPLLLEMDSCWVLTHFPQSPVSPENPDSIKLLFRGLWTRCASTPYLDISLLH